MNLICQYLDGWYEKIFQDTTVLESKANVKRLGRGRQHEDTPIEQTKLARDKTNLEVSNIFSRNTKK